MTEREIVRIYGAEIVYSNGDQLHVTRNAPGIRYSWQLYDEEDNLKAENPDVPGVWAALVGAAAVHHPAHKAESTREAIARATVSAVEMDWDEATDQDNAFMVADHIVAALEAANLAIVDATEYAALRDVLDAKSRCNHPDAYATWECEECFEEGMKRFHELQNERAEREGRVKHFRLVPVQQGGQGE